MSNSIRIHNWRKIFLLAIVLLSFINLSAQDTLQWYYNSKWERVTEKDSATYFRKAFLSSGLWQITDFYVKSMKPEKVGTYRSIKDDIEHGEVVCYYENGNKRSEGRYYDGFKMGFWQTWYEDGVLRSKENYIGEDSIVDKIKKDGIISLGYNVTEGKYFVDSQGVFKGRSEWYHYNGQLAAQEDWNKKLVSVKHWDERGKKVSVPYPYSPEEHPVTDFKNLGQLLKIAWKRIPARNREGKLVVNFWVGIDGGVEKPEITLSSGNKEMDEAVLQVIRQSDKTWIPAKVHNLPIVSKVGLPVRFSNEEPSEENLFWHN